jgi:hypothetical protein
MKGNCKLQIANCKLQIEEASGGLDARRTHRRDKPGGSRRGLFSNLQFAIPDPSDALGGI